MMMLGGKRSSTPRNLRRILPSAERRLRASFPEVWAWYELIVAARGGSELDPSRDEQQEPPQRTLARR